MSNAEATHDLESLDRLMRRHAPDAIHVLGGRASFAEISDPGDGQVWMTTHPMDRTAFEAFETPSPYKKSGVGWASMDAAAFRLSPDGAGGIPVRTREFGGVAFLNVARPIGFEPPAEPGGPLGVSVDKHHTLGFEAQRDVAVLELEGAHYVETVGSHADDTSLVLPPGATLHTLHLEAPWIVDLPSPTTAWFWTRPVVRSFQGPVELPADVSR